MCGRFTHKYTWKQLHRLLNLVSPPFEFMQRFNVAPTQRAPVVREDVSEDRDTKPGRRVDLLRWGLIPSWAKDESFGAKTINARAETVATSQVFRDSFKRRRCLVPVSGFYEWRKIPGGTRKQPYYLTSSDGEPLMLAGLWSPWKSPDGSMETFTIITTTPNEMMAKLHDRMPVILGTDDWAAWLDPVNAREVELSGLLKPYPAELMLAHPVSTRVNSPKNDDQACIQVVDEQQLPTNQEPELFS